QEPEIDATPTCTRGRLSSFFSLWCPPPRTSTLFPYTTLFRSDRRGDAAPRRRGLPDLRRFRNGARRLLPRARQRPRSRKKSTRRSEEHTSELQSLAYLVCRLLLEKKKHHAEPRSTWLSPASTD